MIIFLRTTLLCQHRQEPSHSRYIIQPLVGHHIFLCVRVTESSFRKQSIIIISTSSKSSYSYHILQPLGDPAFEKLHDKNSRSRLVLLNERSSFMLVSLFLCSSLQNRILSKQNLLSLMKRWRWRHLCLCGGWTSTLWICDSFLQQDLSSGVYFRDFNHVNWWIIINHNQSIIIKRCVL